jgi:hypothetical protein
VFVVTHVRPVTVADDGAFRATVEVRIVWSPEAAQPRGVRARSELLQAQADGGGRAAREGRQPPPQAPPEQFVRHDAGASSCLAPAAPLDLDACAEAGRSAIVRLRGRAVAFLPTVATDAVYAAHGAVFAFSPGAPPMLDARLEGDDAWLEPVAIPGLYEPTTSASWCACFAPRIVRVPAATIAAVRASLVRVHTRMGQPQR